MQKVTESLLRYALTSWMPLTAWMPILPPSVQRCWLGPDGSPTLNTLERCWRPAVFSVWTGKGFPCCGRCRLLPRVRDQIFGMLNGNPIARKRQYDYTGGRFLVIRSADSSVVYEEGKDYWFDWGQHMIRSIPGSRIVPGSQVIAEWIEPYKMETNTRIVINLNRAERRRALRSVGER